MTLGVTVFESELFDVFTVLWCGLIVPIDAFCFLALFDLAVFASLLLVWSFCGALLLFWIASLFGSFGIMSSLSLTVFTSWLVWTLLLFCDALVLSALVSMLVLLFGTLALILLLSGSALLLLLVVSAFVLLVLCATLSAVGPLTFAVWVVSLVSMPLSSTTSWVKILLDAESLFTTSLAVSFATLFTTSLAPLLVFS